MHSFFYSFICALNLNFSEPIEINNVVKRGVVDAWLILEGAKHGMLHVHLQWYTLTSDCTDLQAAAARDLHEHGFANSLHRFGQEFEASAFRTQARSYLVCSVGKQREQTAMIMRDDSPVWEQGFTFLVGKPVNDTPQIKIYDQKTGSEIGHYVYILSTLLIKQNMEVVSQPLQLQKSGPESKLNMSLSLPTF